MMKVGLIGLGAMGVNMALNLKDNGHEILGYDISEDARINARKGNLDIYDSQIELVEALGDNKIILISTPAGEITDNVIEQLSEIVSEKDIIIDTGNSYYKDSLKNYEKLKEN